MTWPELFTLMQIEMEEKLGAPARAALHETEAAQMGSLERLRTSGDV